MITYDRHELGDNIRFAMEGGRSKVTFDRFKSWLISAGVSDACIDLFLEYLADEENIFEEDYGVRRFAAEWFDLWSKFEEKCPEAEFLVEDYTDVWEDEEGDDYPEDTEFRWYAVYELDENGDELDPVADFDDEEKAIAEMKRLHSETGSDYHVVIIPTDEDDEMCREWFEYNSDFEMFEVVSSTFEPVDDTD